MIEHPLKEGVGGKRRQSPESKIEINIKTKPPKENPSPTFVFPKQRKTNSKHVLFQTIYRILVALRHVTKVNMTQSYPLLLNVERLDRRLARSERRSSRVRRSSASLRLLTLV